MAHYSGIERDGLIGKDMWLRMMYSKYVLRRQERCCMQRRAGGGLRVTRDVFACFFVCMCVQFGLTDWRLVW